MQKASFAKQYLYIRTFLRQNKKSIFSALLSMRGGRISGRISDLPQSVKTLHFISSNHIPDCPVTVQHAEIANIAAVNEKTTRSTDIPVARDSVKVPVESSHLQYVHVPPIEMAPRTKEPRKKEQSNDESILSVKQIYSTCDNLSHQEMDAIARDDTVQQYATDTRDGYEATGKYDELELQSAKTIHSVELQQSTTQDDRQADGHGKYEGRDNKFGPNHVDGHDTRRDDQPASDRDEVNAQAPANGGGADDERNIVNNKTNVIPKKETMIERVGIDHAEQLILTDRHGTHGGAIDNDTTFDTTIPVVNLNGEDEASSETTIINRGIPLEDATGATEHDPAGAEVYTGVDYKIVYADAGTVNAGVACEIEYDSAVALILEMNHVAPARVDVPAVTHHHQHVDIKSDLNIHATNPPTVITEAVPVEPAPEETPVNEEAADFFSQSDPDIVAMITTRISLTQLSFENSLQEWGNRTLSAVQPQTATAMREPLAEGNKQQSYTQKGGRNLSNSSDNDTYDANAPANASGAAPAFESGATTDDAPGVNIADDMQKSLQMTCSNPRSGCGGLGPAPLYDPEPVQATCINHREGWRKDDGHQVPCNLHHIQVGWRSNASNLHQQHHTAQPQDDPASPRQGRSSQVSPAFSESGRQECVGETAKTHSEDLDGQASQRALH